MKNILYTLALLVSFSSFGQTKDKYMDIQIKADEKARKGDHKGAIIDFTKAINIDPNNAKAYYNRANSKRILKWIVQSKKK